jgi:hypothetical protein
MRKSPSGGHYCPRFCKYYEAIGLAAIAQIKPTGIYSYIDKVQVWLKRAMSKSEIANLRKRCGSLHVRNKPANWNRSFLQRLQICQPQADVLIELAVREHLVNHVEVALNWTFANACDWDAAFEVLRMYLIKKYHGAQVIRVVSREKDGKRSKGPTWYSGQRWKNPTVIAIYAHRPCKITGEVLCVHTEWRMYGVAALRRGGIHSLRDLVTLDYRKFWQQRLLMAMLIRLGSAAAGVGMVGRRGRDAQTKMPSSVEFSYVSAQTWLRRKSLIGTVCRRCIAVRSGFRLITCCPQFTAPTHYYDYVDKWCQITLVPMP